MCGSILSGLFVSLFFLLAFLLKFQSAFLSGRTLFGHGLSVFAQFLLLGGEFGQPTQSGIPFVAASCNALCRIGDFAGKRILFRNDACNRPFEFSDAGIGLPGRFAGLVSRFAPNAGLFL